MNKQQVQNALIMQPPRVFVRKRLDTFLNMPRVNCFFDSSTDVEPGKACEISDLFRSLDESGEVHNYDYSGDEPIRLHGGDFAENETTYQGAYERFQYGEPPQGENQSSAASEAQPASAVEQTQGEQEQSS